MTTTQLVPADIDSRTAEVERQVAEARAQAEAIEVHDESSELLACEALRQIQSRRRAADRERKEIVKPIKDHAKALDQRFKAAMAPYEEADRILREKVGSYRAEQDRIRKEEEARLEAERQERERKAREERERQEAEERAKREQAEADRREAEKIAQEARDDEERAQAEELAEQSRREAEEAKTAEAAIASLPEPTLPKAVVPAAPKPEGISTRKRWVVKAIDAAALPAQYLVPDEGAINRAMREGVKANGAPPEIPGVEFEQVDELAVRA